MESRIHIKEEEKIPYEVLYSRANELITSSEDESYLDPDALIRFLRAREMKVDNALEMWRHWMEWRKSYRADEITDLEVMPQIETGQAFWHGHDNQGRPCLIVKTRYHWPGQFPMDNMIRYCIYLVEIGIKLADETGNGQICVIYDRGQMTEANRDPELIGTMKRLSGMLQDYYAERLGALYVLHVNWVYWLMYQAVKPLLQKKTRNKVHVLRNINGLRDHFSPDQLLTEYGGNNDYVHPYPRR